MTAASPRFNIGNHFSTEKSAVQYAAAIKPLDRNAAGRVSNPIRIRNPQKS
jgi:hypothetical protein